MLKHRLHGGSDARLHHYRESRGAEVDLVSDTAERLVYGGDRAYERRGVQIIPWSRLHQHAW